MAAGQKASDSDGKGSAENQGDAAPESKDEPGKDGADTDQDQDRDTEEHDKKGLKDHPIMLAVGGAAIGLLLIGGLIFWLHSRNFESTDDAFIDAHIVRLAPQVAGRVTQVLVNDNQQVAAGQALITLDSADAQTRVAQAQAQAQQAQAQAQVDNARVQIAANFAGYQQALSDAAAAEAQADNAARDLARYQNLQRTNPLAVAQQQLDQAVAHARQTADQRESAVKAAAAKADQVKASETQVTSGEDQVRAAQAELNAANINYGYNQIVAPIAGHVAQKTVAVGAYAQAGTQLLAIVPLDVWITANFKETQLALMRVGQKVAIKVDACPKAKVEATSTQSSAAPVRLSPSCRRRTPPATSSRWCSASRSRSCSTIRPRTARSARACRSNRPCGCAEHGQSRSSRGRWGRQGWGRGRQRRLDTGALGRGQAQSLVDRGGDLDRHLHDRARHLDRQCRAGAYRRRPVGDL
jgi:membrane fusion protein (multidrug efflux system)